MIINYSDQEVIKGEKSIFLAGPTPRDEKVKSWRMETCNKLNKLGFKGVVYMPENSTKNKKNDYNNQKEWEKEALNEATIILCWVPRNSGGILDFSTTINLGNLMPTGKVVYGRENDISETRYLDWLYNFDYNEEPVSNLDELLELSVSKINSTDKILKKSR